MTLEYFFYNGRIDEFTWWNFILKEKNNELENDYSRITGYGWKDIFVYNPNGEAVYISENNEFYKGVWFETGSRKIAIFER